MSDTLSKPALDALKSRQIAFLHARMISDKARGEWRANLESAYDVLLTRKLSDVVSKEALGRGVDAILARASVPGGGRPLLRALHARVVGELRRDTTHLGDYVPEGTQKKIDALLARPKLVPENLVREVLKQDAIEEMMRDLLYDALKQFNDGVNPFFADWGLPGLLKRFMPIGSGAVIKSLDTVRAEFDKRLEPEIRKFLQGFSKKSLNKLADLAVSSNDDPKAVAVRRAVSAWIYEQETCTLVAGVDDEVVALTDEIATEIFEYVTALEISKKRRGEAIEQLFAQHGDQTLGEALAHHGVTERPDFDVIADLSWPVARAVLESEPVRAWLASLVTEFFDEAAGS